VFNSKGRALACQAWCPGFDPQYLKRERERERERERQRKRERMVILMPGYCCTGTGPYALLLAINGKHDGKQFESFFLRVKHTCAIQSRYFTPMYLSKMKE
jgi:hypothetical protein